MPNRVSVRQLPRLKRSKSLAIGVGSFAIGVVVADDDDRAGGISTRGPSAPVDRACLSACT